MSVFCVGLSYPFSTAMSVITSLVTGFLFGLIILLPSVVSMCSVLPSDANCAQFCP